jgi:hypothetical protein
LDERSENGGIVFKEIRRVCMTEKVSCLPNQFCIDIVACNAAENKLKILRFYTRQRRPANPPMLEP